MKSSFVLRWRYRIIPDHWLGELLSKQWIDSVMPAALLVLCLVYFDFKIDNFVSIDSVDTIGRYLGETIIVVIGMTIVMLAGGIDLSIGAIFALSNLLTLSLFNYLRWTICAVVPAVLLAGALAGLVNGLLIGYLKMRAFLTTLATLIIFRALNDTLSLHFGADVSASSQDSAAWNFLALGSILGLPTSLVVALLLCAAAHLTITRTRIGWHILAVGGSRRSAYNAGISVGRTVCLTYVLSGVMSATSALLYAARLGSVAPETGVGLELAVLTSAVVGGVSIGGGRGSIPKSLIGATLVAVVLNGMALVGAPSGSNSLVMGAILLLAVSFDIRWLKNRGKLVSRVYVSPTYYQLPDLPRISAVEGSKYSINDRLHDVQTLARGELDGPEDIILDSHDNLYTGSRQGKIMYSWPPHYDKWKVFAHTGGFPLGMAMDAEDSIITCIAGMGVYKVTQQRQVIRLTDETNRSLLTLNDDSSLRLADDLDIAPDGRIFFSEATTRYSQEDWIVDALECRGNGRLICYDPRLGKTRTVLPGLLFPNGVCMVGDGESLFFAETWGCRIKRYWFAGKHAGRVSDVITDLPGYPDNINRASDGCFWVAICGMRTPMYDLALTTPGFRKRMAREVARDEWLYPNMNTGCVIKFDLDGRIVDTLWDIQGINHPLITSVREHKGYLYLGGVSNDRIGRYKLPEANPNWTSQSSYWART
jgi:ribose transport system permease protein